MKLKGIFEFCLKPGAAVLSHRLRAKEPGQSVPARGQTKSAREASLPNHWCLLSVPENVAINVEPEFVHEVAGVRRLRSMDEDQGNPNTDQIPYSPVAPPPNLSTFGSSGTRLDYAHACRSPKPTDDANFCIQRESLKAYQKQATWAGLTVFIGALGTIAILLTLRWTIRAVSVSERNAAAAELAVKQSTEALRHAQVISERDLRPWITISARIDSSITLDKLGSIASKGEEKYEFFAELQFTNVGRSAANNVTYSSYTVNLDDDEIVAWFESRVDESVSLVARITRGVSPKYGDTLAPSEGHRTRRWCQFGIKVPKDGRPITEYIQVYVAVIAAYTGTTEDVLFTAKLFPVGFPKVPVFLHPMHRKFLPLGQDEVTFGPVRKGAAA